MIASRPQWLGSGPGGPAAARSNSGGCFCGKQTFARGAGAGGKRYQLPPNRCLARFVTVGSAG